MLRRSDIDLKKAAKLFANRFATGSSVSKNNQGEDEIVIQGDVADEVRLLILPVAVASLGLAHRSRSFCRTRAQKSQPY